MKSIQTRISIIIAIIMIIATTTFMVTTIFRNRSVISSDSDEILLRTADFYAHEMDDNFRSAEQSTGAVYNYAQKRTEAYPTFVTDEKVRKTYTEDVFELGKSIALNTQGAMAVYMRYNPELYGGTEGFWYTIDTETGKWAPEEPTDMSLYDRDDIEHVGWYYIPVDAGVPIWMDPYYNKNLGVYMISYIIPYYHKDQTVGIIGMDIDMSILREAVSKITVYNTRNAFLISQNGDIIYHPDYKDGASIDRLPEGERRKFESYLTMEKDCVNLEKHLGRTPDKVVLKELRNGMILGIDVPRIVIARPLLRLISQLFITSLLITVVSILIGMLWIRSVIKPLRKMTDVADRYAEGDFSEPMAVDSADEVGRLSRSLQTMSVSLKNQIEIADSASKAKTAFLSNMSHEIRTPINAMLGMNEMILRETEEKDTLVYAENIRTAGNMLLGLINDVLDFSKIEAGKLGIVPVDYEVSSVINDLVNMIRIRADEKGLVLILDINRDIPGILNGDEVRVKQIITNILTNAVKYTEKGSITFKVGYEKADEPDAIMLKVSVKDTGIGIRKEDVEKLFAKFERIDEKRLRNVEGTGLGMTITRTLLDMMGSELKVESTYGEGSEFSFSLVQKVVKWDPVGNYEAAYETGIKKNERHKRAFTAKTARVLMVDDNYMNIIVFESLIKETLIKTDSVKSGDECLKLCSDRKYDIIFLDHMMPEKDGVETLHELKEMKNNPNADTPVVCLTANAISGAREEYIREGFDEYLTKPIDTDKLERILMHFLPAEKVDKETDDDMEADVLEFEAGGTEETTDDTEGDNAKRLEILSGQSVIDVERGLKNCGYEDVYIMVLESVFSTMDEALDELNGFMATKDLKNYAIKVHSLKSSLYNIGAAGCGDKAAKLEQAAKTEDFSYISKNHEDLMKECKKIREILHPLF